MIWQLQDAKSKFSQVVNLATQQGPQIVTRHGKKVAVIVSFEEFQQSQHPKSDLLDLLLEVSFEGDGLELQRDREDFGRPILEL